LAVKAFTCWISILSLYVSMTLWQPWYVAFSAVGGHKHVYKLSEEFLCQYELREVQPLT
jgi:hypothetical protein